MSEHPVRSLYQLWFERRDVGWRRTSEEAEATHAVIEIRHGAYRTELAFEMTDDPVQRRNALYRREQAERMLQLAFDAGDRSARADIRLALQGRRQ